MKRDREMRLRDKARAKEERRMARRAEKARRADNPGEDSGDGVATDGTSAPVIGGPGAAQPAAAASPSTTGRS